MHNPQISETSPHFVFPSYHPLQGRALLLLEKYLDAESAFLEGLALDPAHKTLPDNLKRVQEHLAQDEQEQQQLLDQVRRASMDGGSSEAAAVAAVAAAGGSNAAAAAAAAAGGSSARRARSASLETGTAASGLGPKR
jgi:hypothetical protein